MTKRRPPSTLDAALTQVAGTLPGGWGEMAEVTGRRPGFVRAWGDPDRREEIPVRDAVQLDLACRAIGGGSPIAEYYFARLDAFGVFQRADGPALASHAMLSVKECGEAIAAMIAAAQPDATAEHLREARDQIEEALCILRRALPMLVGREAYDRIFQVFTDVERKPGANQPSGRSRIHGDYAGPEEHATGPPD